MSLVTLPSCRVHSTDETGLCSDLTSSQDASQPKAHKKSRLSKGLGGLSSQLSMDDDCEPMQDLVSPIRDKVAPPFHLEKRTFSPPKPRTNPSSPRRKISYVSAVQDGGLISPQSSYLAPLDMLVEENSSDAVFTHQGLLPSRRIPEDDLTPSYTGRLLYKRQSQQQMKPQLEVRSQKRWSADNMPLPLTEIIGPSAPSNSWNNFSFHSHSLQHQHNKGQESNL